MNERRRPRINRPPRIPEAFTRAQRQEGRARTLSNRGLPLELGPSAIVGRVVILDEDSAAASSLADALTGHGHTVELFPNLEEGIGAVGKSAPDVVVIDPFSNEGHGLELIDQLRRVRDPLGATPEIVVVTALRDVDAAVYALHHGASDYLVKPTTPGHFRLAIARALERLRLLNENERLRNDLALFAAAQRILETLDQRQLATYGLDALCSFTRADAGGIFSLENMLMERGLSEAERTALGRLPRTQGKSGRLNLADQGPVLSRFREALVLSLDEDRAAILASIGGFEAVTEDNGLFLARQLHTAFKNVQRFAVAEREARRDSLTDLWNARAFQESIQELAARPESEGIIFSVLFLDIDHFKSVNDRHGHVTGSRLLIELAKVLESATREGDIVGRYGGDEFTVLLPEVDADVAVLVAERIRSTIAGHSFVAPSGAMLPVTVCIGVASFPRHARDAQTILDMADHAMYVGKGTIRNSVHVAAPARTPAGAVT
jgi:diguanylate cyclase (GGDEF)-like protein